MQLWKLDVESQRYILINFAEKEFSETWFKDQNFLFKIQIGKKRILYLS